MATPSTPVKTEEAAQWETTPSQDRCVSLKLSDMYGLEVQSIEEKRGVPQLEVSVDGFSIGIPCQNAVGLNIKAFAFITTGTNVVRANEAMKYAEVISKYLEAVKQFTPEPVAPVATPAAPSAWGNQKVVSSILQKPSVPAPAPAPKVPSIKEIVVESLDKFDHTMYFVMMFTLYEAVINDDNGGSLKGNEQYNLVPIQDVKIKTERLIYIAEEAREYRITAKNSSVVVKCFDDYLQKKISEFKKSGSNRFTGHGHICKVAKMDVWECTGWQFLRELYVTQEDMRPAKLD